MNRTRFAIAAGVFATLTAFASHTASADDTPPPVDPACYQIASCRNALQPDGTFGLHPPQMVAQTVTDSGAQPGSASTGSASTTKGKKASTKKGKKPSSPKGSKPRKAKTPKTPKLPCHHPVFGRCTALG